MSTVLITERKKECKEIKDSAEEEDRAQVGGLTQIAAKKRDGGELNRDEIYKIVSGITDGSLEDTQLGAFLMSVYLKGMSKRETANLTEAMMNSGSVFSWPPSWKVGDKHSTGGVGDKVSIILAPALAVNGLKVPMISGRGLGFTGGTLDKLESIPGYRVNLSSDEMAAILDRVGCCIVGQTGSIVPADRRMYAVRDVTGTVGSKPLIVSSIISKKASESLQGLVLDVKYGSGSFSGPLSNAISLGQDLVDAASSLGIPTTALVSSMECPVGMTVGNSLEIVEAIETMLGRGPADLVDLVVQLGGELLYCCAISQSAAEGCVKIQKSLDDGSALDKFSQMIQGQGVSAELANGLCGSSPDWSLLPKAKTITKIYAEESGYIHGIDALSVAELCLSLGAGRNVSSDPINHGVGLVLKKTVGEYLEVGESWCEIHHDNPHLTQDVALRIKSSLSVSTEELKEAQKSKIVCRISSLDK